MEIRPISDSKTWSEFLHAQRPNTFLQSWHWKEVQEADGEEVSLMGFYDGEDLVGVALVIFVRAKRGHHYLVPHGPIVKEEKYFGEVIRLLTTYCLQQRTKTAVALRIAPLAENTLENQKMFQKAGFVPSPLHVHAELTWVLDIAHPEEELLAGMRKTTRHAIKKAQAEGVNIEVSADISALERFWPLYEATKDRHGFVPFQKSDR